MNYNKVILMGHLARDPEIKTSASGIPFCNITLGVNYGPKDKREVLFMDATAFSKTAEFIGQYFRKGSPILIEGRLTQQKWEKDGQERQRYVVNVESATFGMKDKVDENKAAAAPEYSLAQPDRKPAAKAAFEDELPF